MNTPGTLPVHTIIDLLNTIDPVVSKLKLLSDISPLVDEAPLEDKGRVAIGLLELVSDYVAQLEGTLALFANRLLRGNLAHHLYCDDEGAAHDATN